MSSHDAVRFAQISEELLAEPTQEQTLQRVVDLAVETIPGCDFAGLSLRHDGIVDTPAATDPLVEKADALQYEFAEGPCLDAIWVDDTYVIEDLTKERRWPTWAPRAAELGIRSVLSVRLATASTVVGGLNLYSAGIASYTEDAVMTAPIYAQHASTALQVSNNVAGLRTALQTRHMIGMAQGILIQRYGLTETSSFEFLRRSSQDNNIKLRDVAAKILESVREGGLP
jgi:GAF domain-containing protein